MNYGRLAAAAVAASVVDLAYGFVVYGMLLTGQFGQYPAIFRPPDDMSHFPVLVVGIVIGMIAATWIYAKGYEGGDGLQEGLRFGAALGVFIAGYSAMVTWAVMKIGRALAMSMAAAGFIEWIIIGTVIGLVYKPVVSAAGRRATV